RLGFFLARDGFGDAQHHAPVQYDAKRSRHGGDDLALDLAKRNQVQTRLKLMTGEWRYKLPHFVLRSFVLIGRAVKVNEDDPAATLHHAIGGDWRVKSAGDQRYHPSAATYGKTARAGNLVETEKCVLGKDFDKDCKLRIRQIHAGARPFFDGR